MHRHSVYFLQSEILCVTHVLVMIFRQSKILYLHSVYSIQSEILSQCSGNVIQSETLHLHSRYILFWTNYFTCCLVTLFRAKHCANILDKLFRTKYCIHILILLFRAKYFTNVLVTLFTAKHCTNIQDMLFRTNYRTHILVTLFRAKYCTKGLVIFFRAKSLSSTTATRMTCTQHNAPSPTQNVPGIRTIDGTREKMTTSGQTTGTPLIRNWVKPPVHWSDSFETVIPSTTAYRW